MAFQAHFRVSAIGTLGAANEEMFSYGFSLTGTGGLDANTPYDQELWQDVADSVKDFHAHADAAISPNAVLKTVKIARIATTGLYMERPPMEFTYNQAGGGGGSSYVLPQSALCVSLMTDLVAPQGRGRTFLPMPALAPSAAAAFQCSQADIETVRDRFAQMCSDINNSPGLDALWNVRVCVASKISGNHTVTGVRVGRLIDTIRSRRNKLDEHYVATAAVE